jgi:hypothetical protein
MRWYPSSTRSGAVTLGRLIASIQELVRLGDPIAIGSVVYIELVWASG